MFELIVALIYVGVAFAIAIFSCKWWIKIARHNNFVGKDMNKCDKKEVAEAGGIAVVISIILTITLYIFFKTFVLNSSAHLVEILILTVTLLFACFIGFIDDILGWKKGIAGWKKILMTIPIAIPLMVINAGHATMSIPFIGAVNFGLIYPLIIIPLGVIGATNGFNLLAGHNGLEAGLAAIIFSVLGLIAFNQNQIWLVLIAGIIVASLLGFLIFNRYPARIFPGDSLTYAIGALIACFAILGNMEKAAFFLFIPFIIEGFLKARSKFKAESFGIPQEDNSLELPYKRIYSLTHASILFLKRVKKKACERDVVRLLWIIELIIAVLIIASYV